MQNFVILYIRTILLTEVEVKTVLENLGSGIREKVLWHKYDKCICFLPAASEVFMSLFVIRQENLTEKRHYHFCLP